MGNTVDKLIDGMASTLKTGIDAYADGVRAQHSRELLELVLDRVADPRTFAPILRMGQLAAENFLQARMYNPSAAVEPARQILSALADIQRVSGTIWKWASTPVHGGTSHLLHRSLFWNAQALENTEQLARLERILDEAAAQCDYAVRICLQENHPMRSILPATPISVPSPAGERPVLPIRDNPYNSNKQQVKDVRRRVGALAEYLYRMAGRCITLIEAASLNRGAAYSPNIVREEGALLTERAVVARAACEALARLARQTTYEDETGNEDEAGEPDR